jgi:hypothetical protein
MVDWPRSTRSIPAAIKQIPFDQLVEALLASKVNVVETARTLGVRPTELRHAMAVVPALFDLVMERDEQRLDKAEAHLDAMLESENAGDRKDAAFFVLRQSKRAAQRGWRQPDAEVNGNNNVVNLVPVRYTWRDGTVLCDDLVPAHLLPKTIDHDPDERARVDEERRRQDDNDSR